MRRRLFERRWLCVLLPHQNPLSLHAAVQMGSRDAFGELYEGCRKLGMVVIARTDPHAIHQDAFEAHPEWVMVGADGKPRQALGCIRTCGLPALWGPTTLST